MVLRALISEFKRQKQVVFIMCVRDQLDKTGVSSQLFSFFRSERKGVYRLPTEAIVFSQCPLETPVGQRGQGQARVGKVDLSTGPETPVVLERN